MIQSLESGEVITVNQGYMQSVNPPESFFGFTYWSHLIPPFRPETVLILGYGEGTVSKLIKKIWGENIKVTGIDMVMPDSPTDEDNFILENAADFVHRMSGLIKYDYVVVDLFDGAKCSDLIFTPEFIENVKGLSALRVGLNIRKDEFAKAEQWGKSFKLELVRDIHPGNVEGNLVVFLKAYGN